MSKQDESLDMAKTSYIRLQRTMSDRGNGWIDKIISIKPGQRKAKCVQCSMVTQSDDALPMFEAKELLEYDAYYCSCFGFE